MVHEKHRAVDAQSVAEVAAGHCVRSTIVKQVRSDGTILPCLQTMVPQRDATGRVNAVQRIVFDLSSLQEAERALRRALAQAHDVAERTDDGGGRGALNEELGRTRREYLRVMGSEARRIAALVDELIETASAGALDLEHATVD
jgi:signal transduction histidine kinase